MGSWKETGLVEALLAGGVVAVLIWAARERTRLRGLMAPDAPTRAQAVALLAPVWRCARRRAAARAPSVYLFPSSPSGCDADRRAREAEPESS